MKAGITAALFLCFAGAPGFTQATTPEAVVLAERLAALPTDADRDQLLRSSDAPPTPALFWALRQHADRIFSQADYSSALPLYTFALNLADRLQDHRLRSSALISVASIRRVQGDYDEALALLTESLNIERSNGDQPKVANRLANIADIECIQGSYLSATDHVLEALAFFRGAGDKLSIAQNLNTLARIQEDEGDYRSALASYNQSLALAEELKATDGIAFLSNNIGALYVAQGDLPLAAQYFERSLQLKEKIGNKTAVVNSLINLGDVYQRLGKSVMAEDKLRRALQLAEAGGNKWAIAASTVNLAIVDRSLGHLQAALDRLNTAVQLGDTIGARPVVTNALTSIAEIENLRGNYRAALVSGVRSVAIARELEALKSVQNACDAAGRAALGLGRRAQARAYFTEAIAATEDMRNRVAGGDLQEQSFFASRLDPYYQMVRISLAEHRPEEAIQFAERAKARVVLDAVSRSRTAATKPMTVAEKTAETKLRGRIVTLAALSSRERLSSQPDALKRADLSRRLDAARLEYTAFENAVYVDHPELRGERFESVPPATAEIAASLRKQNAAVVEFVVTDTSTHAFVVTAESVVPRVFTMRVPSREIRKKARRFRERLAAKDLGFEDSATELYSILLAPLQNELRGIATLAIVPDGPLWELPFAALEDRPGHFLIEDHDLFYAPSISVLTAMLRRGARPSSASMSILALGNPAAANLPHAAAEVEALRDIYGAAQSRIYTGDGARKGLLKTEAGRYRILHLATHGVLDDRNPMYSYLALTGNTPDDGLLEAREMMDLDLRADLVVLSGCETARGGISGGEGIVGMSWALFIAGASATLASSWKVDSDSTMRLMIEFHRNFAGSLHTSASRPPMSGALRTAVLRLLEQRQFRHPYFWAGFALVGQVF